MMGRSCSRAWRVAVGTEMREEPHGAGGNPGIGIVKEGGHRFERLLAVLLQPRESEVPDVDGGAPEGLDLAREGGEIEFRDDGPEALRRDAVDRAREGAVLRAVPPHPRIEPIRHVERPIGSDANVGRPEPRVDVTVRPALEVRPGPLHDL